MVRGLFFVSFTDRQGCRRKAEFLKPGDSEKTGSPLRRHLSRTCVETGVPYVGALAVPPSSGAGAPPSPPGGRLPSAAQIFSVLLLNPACKSALYLPITNCRSSLPPGGEGGASAPDEGETGERTHIWHPASILPFCGRSKAASRLDEGEPGERTHIWHSALSQCKKNSDFPCESRKRMV